MISQLDLTIAILCHNYGTFLSEAIQSCLAQDDAGISYEVLVVDDGSTDNTPDVCNSFGNRIRVVRSPDCKGFGATLDRCVSEANGAYICFLDADDYFRSDKLKVLSPLIQSSRFLYIDHENVPVDKCGKLLAVPTSPGNTSTICIRKDAAESLLPVSNEAYFHLLRVDGAWQRLSLPLTYYRIHGRNMSRSGMDAGWQLELSRMHNRLSDRCCKLAVSPPPWTSSNSLRKSYASHAVFTHYHLVEYNLFLGNRYAAVVSAVQMIWVAIARNHAFGFWHLRILARAVLNRPLTHR